MNDERSLICDWDELVALGFSMDEINNHIERWSDKITENVCRKIYPGSWCIDNLKYMQSEDADNDYILYMLFLYTEAFTLKPEVFGGKMQSIKSVLGDGYMSILDDDFWDSGECRSFELLCYENDDDDVWNEELNRLDDYYTRQYCEWGDE